MKRAAHIVLCALWAACAWCAPTPQTVFTLRTRAPKLLCERALDCADAAGVRSHLRLFFYFKFATLGYPSFEHFDADAPLTARVYEDPETLRTFPILFAKSPSPERLVALFGETAARSLGGGWVAIDPLGRARASFADLCAHADPEELARPAQHDLEFSAHPYFHERVRRPAQAEAAALGEGAEALLDEFFTEAESLRTLSLGIDFDKTRVRATALLQAGENTPLERLFNAESGGDVRGARLLNGDAPASFAVNLDSEAVGAYSDALFERFQRRFDGVQADALANLHAYARALLRAQSGGSASNYALRGAQIESETVYDGGGDPSVLHGLLEHLEDADMLFGAPFEGANIARETSVEPFDTGTADIAAFRASTVERATPVWNPQDPSALLRTRARISERYVAAAPNARIATTHPDAMRALARRLSEGREIPDSAYAALGLPLDKGEFFRGKLDLPSLLRDWLFYRAKSERRTPLSYALEKLSDERLSPARLSGRNGGGRLQIVCELPLPTLLRLAETLRAADPAF